MTHCCTMEFSKNIYGWIDCPAGFGNWDEPSATRLAIKCRHCGKVLVWYDHAQPAPENAEFYIDEYVPQNEMELWIASGTGHPVKNKHGDHTQFLHQLEGMSGYYH